MRARRKLDVVVFGGGAGRKGMDIVQVRTHYACAANSLVFCPPIPKVRWWVSKYLLEWVLSYEFGVIKTTWIMKIFVLSQSSRT